MAWRSFYQAVGLCQLGLAQVQASLGKRAAALRHLAGMRPWIRTTRSEVGAFLRILVAAQFALAWGQQHERAACCAGRSRWDAQKVISFFPSLNRTTWPGSVRWRWRPTSKLATSRP